MKFHIREAIIPDIPRLAFISFTAWKQSYPGIIEQTYLETLSYKDRLKSRHLFFQFPSPKICFVAVVEDIIIGFCDVSLARKAPETNCKGEVYALYILEEYKRQGIGTALWQATINYLHTQKLRPFKAQVLKDNMVARHFYEKKGGVLHNIIDVQIGSTSYEEVCYIFQ